jgi:hypothetical protein
MQEPCLSPSDTPGRHDLLIIEANPLTYQVDALRQLRLPGFTSLADQGLAIDAAVLAAALVVLVAACAKLYRDLAR